MPHTFRTIEQFVQLLEGLVVDSQRLHVASFNDSRSDAAEYWSGRMEAYKRVLQIVRTSNIGIVYPPPERCGICIVCRGLAQGACPGHAALVTGNAVYGKMAAPPLESNGTRCPDCGLPCDPATGEHVCSDGQVRGFRVSP